MPVAATIPPEFNEVPVGDDPDMSAGVRCCDRLIDKVPEMAEGKFYVIFLPDPGDPVDELSNPQIALAVDEGGLDVILCRLQTQLQLIPADDATWELSDIKLVGSMLAADPGHAVVPVEIKECW